MNCDERQRSLISGPLSEEDLSHLETCDSCMEVMISKYMILQADVALAARRLPSSKVLIWKCHLRERMRTQAPIVRIHGFIVVGICLVSWITMAALSSWIFAKQHWLDHSPLSSEAPALVSAALFLTMVLGGWAVRTAAREIASTRLFFSRDWIRRM
jgi:hypothetical protein